MTQYSIAIQPPVAGISLVDSLKDLLFSKIGWFRSRNSKAHITISQFMADEEFQLASIKRLLNRIAKRQKSIDVRFDKTGALSNAFCLMPSNESLQPLRQIMRAIQSKVKITNAFKSDLPHISIGRGLTEEQLKIADELIKHVQLNFQCCGIILRRFNSNIGQYEVAAEFPFGNESNSEATQLPLYY